MDLPYSSMPLHVRLVVGATQQLAEPHLKRRMEALRLGLVDEYRERSRVHPDDGVELVGNGRERRLGCDAESREERCVLRGEANVASQLRQQRAPSFHESIAYHVLLPTLRSPRTGCVAAQSLRRATGAPRTHVPAATRAAKKGLMGLPPIVHGTHVAYRGHAHCSGCPAMNARPPILSGEEVPLVRLRVRALQRVRHDGDRSAVSTVFCPARRRSTDVDTCRRCPRLSNAAQDAIECAAAKSQPLARDLLADARLGGDACVGEAMGCVAVAVHADVKANAVVRSLEEEGIIVAIVVDDAGRLVGLVDAADAARATEPVRACELARRVTPVHEAARLVHAVDRMVRDRARALPVIDDDGYVVALLTDLDALHWVAGRGGPR